MRKDRSVRNLESTKPVPENLRERTIGHAKLFGAIWLVVFIVDLVTGAPFWAHWPGLAMGTLIALKATPLFVRGWFKLPYVRGIVIVGALALVNLFTWSGYPWVMWPGAAIITIELIRRFGVLSK